MLGTTLIHFVVTHLLLLQLIADLVNRPILIEVLHSYPAFLASANKIQLHIYHTATPDSWVRVNVVKI